jgi:phage gp36-like protein
MLLSACVTVDNLVLALEPNEILELSRLTDPLATTIDTLKVQYALDRTTELLNSYYLISNNCGKAYIKMVCKQTTIWIARYFLDTTKSRPFVEQDYERAMELLKYACTDCTKNCPLTPQQIANLLGTDVISSNLRCCTSAATFKSKNLTSRIYNDNIS